LTPPPLTEYFSHWWKWLKTSLPKTLRPDSRTWSFHPSRIESWRGGNVRYANAQGRRYLNGKYACEVLGQNQAHVTKRLLLTCRSQYQRSYAGWLYELRKVTFRKEPLDPASLVADASSNPCRQLPVSHDRPIFLQQRDSGE
jgi:hypothetical protein